MKKIILILILGCMVETVWSQTTIPSDTSYWHHKAELGLGLNQTSVSSNWKGGGANALSFSSVCNVKIEYYKDKLSFVNDLQLQYGRLYNQNEAPNLPAYRKTQDRIFFDSKLGRNISKYWSVFASLNLQSQFDDGYKYGTDTAGREVATLSSRFFAPAYVTESVGLEYKPVPYFSVRGGVGTMRQTILSDPNLYKTEPSNYGVDTGKTVRNEIAFMLIATFDKEISKSTTLKARYQGFANYEDMEAIDSRLDVSLITRISKYLNFTFTGVLLYDQDQDLEMQYSQSMALGVLVKF